MDIYHLENKNPMKALILLNIFIILLFYSCQKEFNPDNKLIQLKYQVTQTFDDYNFNICFDSVDDGRCPIGVFCIWGGNAAVSFKFTHRNKETRFVLNTAGGNYFRSDTTIGNYNIKLIRLNPMNPPGNPEDYRAEVLITN
jgi:hypothetical protein